MTDHVPDTKPSTRWFWVLALVLLAVAVVIFVFDADGDEELETIPDYAITTTEERLNTDLETAPLEEGLDDVRGAENLSVEDGEVVTEPAAE